MNKIKCNILNDEENVFLVFNFEEKIMLNFTDDCADNAKKVFYKILEYIIEEQEMELEFDKEGIDNLFTEIAEKYVKDLNLEISKLRDSYLEPVAN